MKSVKDVDIAGKKVLVRVDFNVPLDGQGGVSDDTRIKAVMPTLTYVLAQHAALIVASHLGRPKGEVRPEFSLKPVAERLSTLLDRPVKFAQACVGPVAEEAVASLAAGEVLLLENLRFEPGEQQNDDDFARKLGQLCDVYVNDAFAVCHRANASVEAITRHAPLCAAGMLLEKELTYFERAMDDPQRPLAAIVGGAKVSSKLAALKNMLQRVDKILIGGAMANTFLKARGVEMGASKIEADLIEAAIDIMAQARQKKVTLLLPVDVVAATHPKAESASGRFDVEAMPANLMALDIGPGTVQLFADTLSDAKTVIWNGPMGVFEEAPFSDGTYAMVDCVAELEALTIAGGGDTNAAVQAAGRAADFSYLSTGGGAFLTLMEGNPLPAVDALLKSQQ
jgi:phosphoglycerate kinase